MIKKNIQRNKNTNKNGRSDSQYEEIEEIEEIEENEGFRRRNHKMYYFNKNNFFLQYNFSLYF